jgi:pimeloyl-ACP methyl ester carboxylesterase
MSESDDTAPTDMFCAGKSGPLLLNGGCLDLVLRLPLPGIVIFVHGVNSDGEWYEQSELGLCRGLNTRLKRRDEDIAHPGVEGGQLTPATYLSELTDDGFLNPERSFRNFTGDDEHFTPVIRFRWGYKASLQELQDYGDSIYLNEQNYWGGGPFANGCTALPDLWSAGLSEKLFLWLHVQHLNPVNNRNVYACPPRPYFVVAALRLAKLIKSIRELQADVPITLVCHSQGNMVGMAAAFLGDRMGTVHDQTGAAGRCVADSYVLCNPPYSLLEKNRTENWTESHMKDRHGGSGRQTLAARINTLRAFFDIVRRQASSQQPADRIDKHVANSKCGFDTASDRVACGLGTQPSTCGRVTLYCCPHDQVISALSIQGIGWRGMSLYEIQATGGDGVFCQRVFAQGFTVGEKGTYHYWDNHYRKLPRDSDDFWYPLSRPAEYSVSKGILSNRSYYGKILTFLTAPLMIFALKTFTMRVNALPDRHWWIPLDAPTLPPYQPTSVRFGQVADFDQGYDAPGEHRSVSRASIAGDPYAFDGNASAPDTPKGDRDSEARLRYEDRGFLRMQAKREGLAKNGDTIEGETREGTVTAEHKAWRDQHIKTNLAANVKDNATDHSTIMTNPENAEKALAYDVAVGLCRISTAALHELRIVADWRLHRGLDVDSPHKALATYFRHGEVEGKSVNSWASEAESEGLMPNKIDDRRENTPPVPHIPGA